MLIVPIVTKSSQFQMSDLKERFVVQWQKKLTKKELQHLRDTGANTLADVRENVLYQAKNRFPCWECVGIGRKLDISVELTAFHQED